MNSSTRQQKELKKEISLAKKLEEESQKKIRDHESKAKSFEKQEEVSDRLLILKEENNFLLNVLKSFNKGSSQFSHCIWRAR